MALTTIHAEAVKPGFTASDGVAMPSDHHNLYKSSRYYTGRRNTTHSSLTTVYMYFCL